MEFDIGDPVQIKSYGNYWWKGYIAWYFEESDEYLLSCDGHSTYSHTTKVHSSQIHRRSMTKRELSIQKRFREFAMQQWVTNKHIPNNREFSCEGCPMLPGKENLKDYQMSKDLFNRCEIRGKYHGTADIYPFRKTRCLVRPSSPKEARALQEKIIANRKKWKKNLDEQDKQR